MLGIAMFGPKCLSTDGRAPELNIFLQYSVVFETKKRILDRYLSPQRSYFITFGCTFRLFCLCIYLFGGGWRGVELASPK